MRITWFVTEMQRRTLSGKGRSGGTWEKSVSPAGDGVTKASDRNCLRWRMDSAVGGQMSESPPEVVVIKTDSTGKCSPVCTGPRNTRTAATMCESNFFSPRFQALYTATNFT